MSDLVITGMVYNTVCGLESTTMTAALDSSNVYTIIPNYHTPLTITGTATSTNPNCVIKDPFDIDSTSSS